MFKAYIIITTTTTTSIIIIIIRASHIRGTMTEPETDARRQNVNPFGEIWGAAIAQWLERRRRTADRKVVNFLSPGSTWHADSYFHRNHNAYWGRGEVGKGLWRWGDYIPIADTVTTRMTSALRWAAMRAILMFHNCEGQSRNKTVSTDRNL